MMAHDHAGVLCEPCDSYGDGYTAGKQAAHFEIRMWELGGYAPVSAHHVRVPDPQALRSRLTGDAGPVRVTLCSENGDPLQGLNWALPRPGDRRSTIYFVKRQELCTSRRGDRQEL